MRRSTFVYLLLFALTVGAYYYLKDNPITPAEETPEVAFTFEPAPEISYLFPAELGEPVNIHLSAKTGEAVELTRNDENAWVLKQPLEVAADQTGVAAAISQIVTIQVLERLSGIEASDLGLDAPEYTLTVSFEGDVQRIIQLGVVTPSETGYYALADNEIIIVSKPTFDALIGLIANPPYAETLTPSPTLTETSLPTTETLVPAPESTTTLTPTP